MIRFEDLMASRWLYRQCPEHRDVLLAGLEALSEGESQRSLLGGLVSTQVISSEQAHFVHTQIEQHIRGRGLGIYAHLLQREGVPAQRVQSLLQRMGPEGDINRLGDTLIAVGLLPPAREQQLRFQARLALDRDMAMQVHQHVAGYADRSRSSLSGEGTPAEAATEVGGEDESEKRLFISSTVIKGLEAMQISRHIPQEEEARAIVAGTLSDADNELPGPRFRIPDWIDMSHPRTGKAMAGYRLLGLIGAGAMGEVYLADHQDDPERPVALKVLGNDASDDARGRFKREILANSFFSHEGALDVYDAGRTQHGYHYLAMEFFDGRDLEKVLDETRRLPPKKAVELARQVFETLRATHEAGLVHRDVKPANILVSWEGDTARLMDYGIAVIRDLNEFKDKIFTSMEGGVTGTPEYMSPEQAGGEELSASSDLYSMGVVLYHMLAGRLPFDSETTSGFMTCHMIEDPLPLAEADPACKALPSELCALMAGLLQKDSRDRPATAADVVAQLDALMPKLGARAGGRLFSFLGWRRS